MTSISKSGICSLNRLSIFSRSSSLSSSLSKLPTSKTFSSNNAFQISSRNLSSTSSYLSSQPNTSNSNLNLSTSLETDQASKDFDQQIKDAKAHLAQMGFHNVTWVQQMVWGDHDQFQHVNNVHYVRFFETGRMRFAEMFSSSMAPQRRLEIIRGTGVSMILAAIHVKYRKPVVYPDTLVIAHAALLPLGKDRFSLRGVAYSLKDKAVVAVSKEDCVVYDYTKLSKCEMPDDLREALEIRGITEEEGKKRY